MPIMAIYRSRDIDRETYNRYRVEVPIEAIPGGAISHHLAFDDQEGMICVDVWESLEQLNAFQEQRVNPGVRKLGLEPLKPQVLELHALWTAQDGHLHNVANPPPAAEAA